MYQYFMNDRNVFFLKNILLVLSCLMLFVPTCSYSAEINEEVNLGLWSKEKVEDVIRQAKGLTSSGEKIAQISAEFLGTPYMSGTLLGSIHETESLVIRFDGVDCFTLLDYVEALRRSDSFSDFKHELITVRYKSSQVGYVTRNHFFTDWVGSNSTHIVDVTRQVGGRQALYADKQLNRKTGGTVFLDGYPIVPRRVYYIPGELINFAILRQLQTGDYVGIYSSRDGLDVSHSGIIIKDRGQVFLRHASSEKAIRSVVDVELLSYLNGRKGIVVLRSR